MPNLFDYLNWRGDLKITQDGFNDVDSLILCRLSYLPFDGIVPGPEEGPPLTVEAAAAPFLEPNGLKRRNPLPKVLLRDDLKLLKVLANCPRFSHMKLKRYVNRIDLMQEKQFSALTVDLDDGSCYVAYRGTDDTIVGWKEDFNMSFIVPVPAQLDAVAYLEQTAAAIPGALRVGGHSKGGNLAVYGAAFAAPAVQQRLTDVYSNDGPGFLATVLESPGYQQIRQKIRNFVPQSSVVGMLLDHGESYTVVRSKQIGLLQHDLFSWQVIGANFVSLDEITDGSRFLDQSLREWLSGMDQPQREKFVDTLFEVLESTNAKTLQELAAGGFKNAGTVLRSFRNLDEDEQKMISRILALLLRSTTKTFPNLLPRLSERN